MSIAIPNVVFYLAMVLHAQFLPMNFFIFCVSFWLNPSWYLVPGGYRWFQFVPDGSSSFQFVPVRSRWFQLVSGSSSSFQFVPRFNMYALRGSQ